MSDGDSITAGTATTSYPQVAANSLTPNTIRLYDVGASGQSCAQRAAAVSTSVVPKFDTLEARNAASLLCGANDWTNGTTDASSYSSILTWVSAVKAAGFQAIVLTGPSRSLSPLGTVNSNGVTGDQYMQALAARITGGAVANGYTVADVNSDVTIGCTGCYSNLTYFQSDGLHPTQAGYNIIGSYLKTALQSLGFY